jgi:hypothetical protein
MNADLRQQILVQLRAEGVGEADKAREALANVNAEMKRVAKEFGEGALLAEDFRKAITSLGTAWTFWNGIVKESEQDLARIDRAIEKTMVGLAKLQVEGIKFSEDHKRSKAEEAQAAEDAAIREAEAFAKVVVDHERFLAQAQAAEEAAELKDAERVAAMTARHEEAEAKKTAAAEAAEIKDAELVARMAMQQEEAEAREALAVEQAEAKKTAARQAAGLKEAQLLTRMTADRREAAEQQVAADVLAAGQRHLQVLTNAEVREDVALRGRQAGAIAQVVAEERQLTETLYALAAASDMTEKMTAREIEAWRRSRGEMQQAGAGYTNVSFAMMNFSYTLQDLTSANGDWERGLMATINNVPLLAASFAQAAGITQQSAMMWGAGLGVVAVAAMELYKNWDGLMDAMGLGTVRTEAERMEELGRKTHKTAQETAEYNRHKREQSEIEQMMQAQSKEEKDRASMVREAIAEADPRKVRESLFAAMGQRGLLAGPTVAEREAIAYEESEVARLGGPGAMLAQIDVRKLETLRTAQALRIRDENERRVGAMMTGAGKDPSGLLNLAQGRPDLFPPELVGALMEAMPERFRQRREDAADVKHQEQAAKLDKELREQQKRVAADELREAGLAQAELEKGNREAAARRERREREARGVVEAEKRAREQQVQAGVQQFAPEMMKAEGEGSFMDAVFRRLHAGQKDADVQGGMRGKMTRRLREQGAQENLVDEIANGVIEQGLARAHAVMAADGGAAREAKGNRKMAGDVKAAGKEFGAARREAIATDIFNRAGNLSPDASRMAADHAIKAMKDGWNYATSLQMGYTQTMHQILGMMENMQHQQQHMQQQLNGVNGRVHQMRARRPGLMPMQPPN